MADTFAKNRWASTRYYHDERKRISEARRSAREKRQEEGNLPQGWWLVLFFALQAVSPVLVLATLVALIYLEKLIGYKFLGLSGGFVLLAILIYFIRIANKYVDSQVGESPAQKHMDARHTLLAASAQFSVSEPLAQAGAILSLEDLGLQHPSLVDQVLRLLALFLKHEIPLGFHDPDQLQLQERSIANTHKEIPVANVPLAVQVALDTIGRLGPLPFSHERLDLSMLDLHSVNLNSANLRRSLLVHARLDCSDLHSAVLEWADLSYASLRYASFTEAELNYARLDHADLRETYFWESKLRHAQFAYSDLRGAHFVGADLEASAFIGANLEDAVLARSNLKRATLLHAKLGRAILAETDFSDANLEGADLSEADLRSANVAGALLSKANLRGANLDGVNIQAAKGITEEQLSEANFSGPRPQLNIDGAPV